MLKGGYLARAENVILTGDIGSGKSYLATALGIVARHQGRRVRFATVAALVNELQESQDEHQLTTTTSTLWQSEGQGCRRSDTRTRGGAASMAVSFVLAMRRPVHRSPSARAPAITRVR